MAKPSPLALVNPSATLPHPPRKLGAAGLALWNSVQEAYQVEDVAGVELLVQACAAADRVEALGARIAKDGEVITSDGGGLKPHPALASELANRNFIIRVFDKLGLNFEPLRPAGGRPPKPEGWRGRAD
jgi:hypothetical protein